jgi:hypothetical protein
MAVRLMEQAEERTAKKNMKDEIRAFINIKGMCKTKDIEERFGLESEETFNILQDMAKNDKSISGTGQLRIERANEILWMPRSN